MTETLTLYYHPYSNCAQRVMLALAEKGLTPQKIKINLMANEQLSDHYRAINPKCEVPALVHNNHSITESCTILSYLEQQFPKVSLTPQQPEQAQLMTRWLEKAAQSHEHQVVNFVYANGLGRLPTPEQWRYYEQHVPHRAEFHRKRRLGKAGSDLQQAKSVLDAQFEEIECQLSKTAWLAGSEYSLADIAWYPNAKLLSRLGYDVHPFPYVRQWLRRIEARPAYQAGIKPEMMPLPNWLLRVALRLIRRVGGRF
ncbi:glutathione S-transferase family protein [Ferrimonas aestuarii]|nr:glutathione S-transferase family protein [Ferrimonas aestuarii]